MKTKRSKKTYSIRMDPLTWEGIVTMATENDLTISDQIGMILKWALKRWEMPQPPTTNTIRRSEPGRYKSQYTPNKQQTKEKPEDPLEKKYEYAWETIEEVKAYHAKHPGGIFPVTRDWIRELDENPNIDGSDLIDLGILDPHDASQR